MYAGPSLLYGSWCLVIYKIHGVLVMERNDQVTPNHKKRGGWPHWQGYFNKDGLTLHSRLDGKPSKTKIPRMDSRPYIRIS